MAPAKVAAAQRVTGINLELAEIISGLEARFANVVPFDEKQTNWGVAPLSEDDALSAFEQNVTAWVIPDNATLFWRGKPQLEHSDAKYPDAPRPKTKFSVVCRCVWSP